MDCTIHGKKGAIASRRLDFYLLVHGRYFISLLPPIGNQWRRSPIRHLGTRPLGVTGSPEGLFPSKTAAQQKKILYPATDTRTCQH
ncbi:hypothetical protein TNCV_3168021 [Trichonephila clavipes]|uniref:Uncharacterized protein n=1 Tax=Trichonephila clavipes TaxID=2585209 RepID=A0A8X6R9L3_TRICX|nr:hypothetical protein TNCV_3168021 [Trichonephila clavipes]